MTRVWIGVILVVVLAFFLRIYRIESVPPALNWDEVSIGYNAYSIMKTGRDEWGEWMPLHFKSYGEYKLPGQIYASIPGIAIFGLNEFGVRITPVVYGSLTILIVFLLARSLFASNKIGLLSALFVAVSPWHIQLTRGSFESSFALFWVLLGLWFWVEGAVKLRWLWLVTVLCFVLAIYTYNSERGFIPLLILGLMWIYRKAIMDSKKVFFSAGLLFVLLLVPLAPFILSGEGGARYKLVSVADDPGLLPRVNEARGNSTSSKRPRRCSKTGFGKKKPWRS
jgi:4-amino-4-deoxy-L-arabinose transferase-like glycosyltransferase